MQPLRVGATVTVVDQADTAMGVTSPSRAELRRERAVDPWLVSEEDAPAEDHLKIKKNSKMRRRNKVFMLHKDR